MGVRYNAEKTKVGKYFSTPIHKFRMKCHLCDQHFEIQTDPKNLDYVILSGARRKEQRWDMAENEQIVTEEKSDIKRLAIDPMFNLEHQVNDQTKIAKLMPTLRELEETKSEWKDDYKLNSLMRNVLRGEKKAINEEKAKDKELLDKWNINIDLVKENEQDVKLASLYKYNTVDQNEELNLAEKRKHVETESIFDVDRSKSLRKSLETDKSLKSSLLTLGKNKEAQKSGLVNKLNKSVQSKMLSSTGFNLTSPVSNSADKSTRDDAQLKSISKFIVKANKNSSLNTSQTETSLNDEATSSKSCSATNGLVSNDYGASSNSSSDENS